MGHNLELSGYRTERLTGVEVLGGASPNLWHGGCALRHFLTVSSLDHPSRCRSWLIQNSWSLSSFRPSQHSLCYATRLATGAEYQYLALVWLGRNSPSPTSLSHSSTLLSPVRYSVDVQARITAVHALSQHIVRGAHRNWL